MNKSKRRGQRRATLLGASLGVIIIVTFVLTLVAPDLGSRSSSSEIDPFATPRPTELIIPTPDPNPQLEGRPVYIHSSGLFQTFMPAGSDWYVDEGESVGASAAARVVISSPQRLAVIHNYIQPGVQYESLAALSENFLTGQHFAGAWQDYDSWQETGRQVTDEGVVVNFALVSQGHDYLGRSIARLFDDWLFVTRLVVPANNAVLLDRLQALVVPAFSGFKTLLALPAAWPAAIDQQAGWVLKHPTGWSQVAGSPGRPMTFLLGTGNNDERVRVWTEAQIPLESAEAARAWAENSELLAAEEVLGAEAIQREAGTGYLVAYRFRDLAGDLHSGLLTLLNDEAGTLFVADLQIDPPDASLLAGDEVLVAYAEARQAVAEGFIVLPEASRAMAAGS